MISHWENVFYKYDLIIVGAGITGLSLAASILERSPQINLAIIEKDSIPASASTRNAGFACFGSLSELISDRKSMGEEKMLELVEDRWKGFHKLKKRLGDENIQYQNSGGYEILTDTNLELLEARDEINYLLKDIIGDETFSVRNELIREFGFDTDWCKSLVFNPYEGNLHSGKMIRSLRKKVKEIGGEIIGGIEILGFKENENEVRLRTNHDTDFSCSQAVFCNNAYASKLFPAEDIKAGRGLIMLSGEMDIPFKGSFHLDEGFYYFRDLGKRLLIGGGRNEDFSGEETFENGINPKIREAILEKTNLILNGRKFQDELWWSGIMAFGSSKEPILKRIGSRTSLIARLSGMGVALASQLGEKWAEEILN